MKAGQEKLELNEEIQQQIQKVVEKKITWS